MSLSHPEAFAVGDAEDLAAMGAEIDVTLAQKASEQLHPKRRQGGRTMRADRLNILSDFQIDHLKSPFLQIVMYLFE